MPKKHDSYIRTFDCLEYIIDLMSFLQIFTTVALVPVSFYVGHGPIQLISSFSFNVQIEKQSPVHGPGIVETQKLMAYCDNYIPDHIIM